MVPRRHRRATRYALRTWAFGEDESLSPWRWDADDEEDAEWDSHWAGVLERVEYEVASTPRRNTELEMV